MHDGHVTPQVERLREAYVDAAAPAQDDTVTRLFGRYIDATDEAGTAPSRSRPRVSRRLLHVARSVRRRLGRA